MSFNVFTLYTVLQYQHVGALNKLSMCKKRENAKKSLLLESDYDEVVMCKRLF